MYIDCVIEFMVWNDILEGLELVKFFIIGLYNISLLIVICKVKGWYCFDYGKFIGCVGML